MFRRKEENATDSTNPATVAAAASGGTATETTTANSSSGSSPATASSSATSGTTSGSGAQSASSTYVPTTPPQRSEAPRERHNAPAAANYRPTPIAEFSRSNPRTPTAAETMRNVAPQAAATSSFSHGTTAERNSGTSTGKSSSRRVLTVGNDILLKGEIATCDRLVIEGRVEAKLSDVHTVEIAESGSFKGTAEVEDAEISGLFEGDLIVRNRMVIYASGEVRGNISYGEIEIERGGKMTGQIKTGAQAKGGKLDEKRPSRDAAA